MPAGRDLRFRGLYGGAVRARIEASEVIPVAEGIFADRRVPVGESNQRQEPAVRLYHGGEGYLLTGPSGRWYAELPGEALANYEVELMNLLLAGTDGFIHLHAAAVQGPGGLVLLVGDSGSGKSTLSTGLRLAGFDPLGDDLVMLDPGSASRVVPFPRSIRLHRDAVERHRWTATLPEGAQLSEPFLWLHPRAEVFGQETIEPGAFVFLEAGSATALQTLSGAQKLSRLLRARFGRGEAVRDFECLRDLSVRVPGFVLKVSDFARAVDVLALDLLSGANPARQVGAQVR